MILRNVASNLCKNEIKKYICTVKKSCSFVSSHCKSLRQFFFKFITYLIKIFCVILFKIFCIFYFQALAPPGLIKISDSLFTFLDQSDSSAAAILGMYLHPEYIHENFGKLTNFAYVFPALSFAFTSIFIIKV